MIITFICFKTFMVKMLHFDWAETVAKHKHISPVATRGDNKYYFKKCLINI